MSTLYKSFELAKYHPQIFITRLIYDVAFITLFCPGKLADLKMSNVNLTGAGDQKCFCIVGRLKRSQDSAMNRQGDLKKVNYKRLEVFICHKSLVFGFADVDGDIKVYHDCPQTF